MEETKPVQVVMLPTKDNTKIFYHKLSGKIGWTEVSLKIRHARISQHLYFISTDPNEEIKDGDYIRKGDVIVKCTMHLGDLCYQLVEGSTIWYILDMIDDRKIIASTDPSLGLPAIPTTWIRDVYVPSNGSIKEVRLKIDEDFDDWYEQMELKSYPYYKPELTPDNEVVIVDIPKEFTEAKEWAEKVNKTLNWSDKELVDQELEDVAKRSVGDLDDIVNVSAYNGFIEGATWKAEQSANDAIEFMRWTRSQCEYFIFGKDRNIKLGTSDYITDKELYKLWQQSKSK